MDFKTLSKSKSSNIANASKADQSKKKKSLSNAEFQPFVIKKRGVYVEKKVLSSTDTQGANNKPTKAKPPPRPKPGQKRFLASVLTILSKSTTGTQYPDIQEDDKNTKLKPRYRNTKEAAPKSVQRINKTKKTKYRSRVLNKEMLNAEREQLIILQSKKDIAQTPSNYSSRSKNGTDSVKWSDMLDDNEPKRRTIRDILENTVYSGVAEGVTKEVLEGTTKREKKLRINDDPVTLASEIAKKDEKKLYNFFVDLLETTISVYNVQADYQASDVSKTVLEINDSVAKKLEFKHDTSSHANIDMSNCRGTDKTEDAFVYEENIPIDIKLSEYRPLAPIRPKIKAKSFLCTSRKSQPSSSSFDRCKKSYRRPKKKALLTILKEQLQNDTYAFEEPDSLYDALKVIARNKRKCEKSIRFEKKPLNNAYDYECMFERRKLLSFRSRKKNKTFKNPIPMHESGNHSHIYDEELEGMKNYPSYHSLEVYGYDYEDPVQRPELKRERRVIFTYHSTPSNSESNLADYNAIINYPGSSVASNYSMFNR